MDDERHAIRSRYIRDMGDQMLLRDWDLRLSRAPADDDSHATIRVHDAKNKGEVRLGADWSSRTPEERRQTMTHELLHCHTARLCRVMGRLKDQGASDLANYINAAFEDEEEIAIETLARVLAPHLPLPEAD